MFLGALPIEHDIIVLHTCEHGLKVHLCEVEKRLTDSLEFAFDTTLVVFVSVRLWSGRDELGYPCRTV